ncbi:MAG: ATP-dependent DNA helicase RecG [Parcubacteria group bacterium Gr01-1014_3]|nr:MAG: ATP-dependent DNA helicase RecG [Parcubacteria group bacterium Gr01-1014_3]
MLKLTTQIALIQGLPSKFVSNLKKLDILTIKDLLLHFPTRYEDFSSVVKIADLKVNEAATISGFVKRIESRRSWRRKIFVIEASIMDETGSIKALWFNQPYIAKVLQPGRRINFAGKVTVSDDELCLSGPTFEFVGAGEAKHTAGLIPIYPETKGLTSKGIRYLMRAALTNLEPVADFIPKAILAEHALPDVTKSFQTIHFPKSMEDVEIARQRFAFEDLFLLQLNNAKARLDLAKEKAPSLKFTDEDLTAILKNLPFELTASQLTSVKEILSDLSGTKPMNRLLQGDVGSGKTVVAAIAAIVAAKNGKQTALMAPTEVLARQHYKTLTSIFGKHGVGIGLLTSGEARSFFGENLEAKTTKPKLLKDIESGKITLVIGTHAIISTGKDRVPVAFNDLALAIVDEQHRFGVEQRAALVKQERNPGDETTIHFLSMSATPIPRTLSLTLFGDLDLSIINELPKGRKEIITKVVAPTNRAKAYQFVREQVLQGRQVFVICPRIEAAVEEESDEANPKLKLWSDVKAVKEEFERLSTKIFPDLKLAMLHGKLKAAEKSKIMADFMAGQTNILVSTSVIEVGVDVQNANIMIIEGADRFGLAQLYQFRGRVGRGEHQSYCLLFTDSSSDSTSQRLNALLRAKNGFELAEEDLKLRGPGQFIGSKQTGIPDLAMKALNNIELIKMARTSADIILKEDARLTKYAPLRAVLKAFQKKIHLE